MPKIHSAHEAPQGEIEWHRLRIGKVTASEASNLLTPEFKEKTGDTPRTFLYRKLAERWQGHALPGFTSWQTEQGNIKEERAIPWFRLEFDSLNVRRVGFVETDDGIAGCSPDALIGEDSGLEVKCPEAPNQARYLVEGKLPADYRVQVHFSMYVTGRPRWMFLSYRPKFPAFILQVERDEEICSKIHDVVTKFHASLNAAFETLTQKNQ